jgi:crotonobetainyl-CoA hydratase
MIRTERRGRVLLVTLANPKVNAIGLEMSRMLASAFDDFERDAGLHVAVLHGGRGPVFSAGWDLKAAAFEGLNEDADYGSGGFAGVTERFTLKKPVIAAVNGIAIGAGVEIALACDLIVAAETTEFRLPETSLGLMADAGGVQRLPRKLPENFAMEMLLTGRPLTASDGLRFGLFNHVVPPGEVLPKALLIAEEIAGAAPLAVRAIKEVVSETLHLSVAEAFARTRAKSFSTYAAMLKSDDHEEGPRAFAEKRPAVWKGR